MIRSRHMVVSSNNDRPQPRSGPHPPLTWNATPPLSRRRSRNWFACTSSEIAIASAATTSPSRSAMRWRRWSSTVRCGRALWPSGCFSTRARRAGSSATLVKKGYVEQRADEAMVGRWRCRSRATGRRLYKRITDDLVEQQKHLLQDLDPEVRDGVVSVIRGLARAADSRFRSGVSVGPGGVLRART